MHEEFVLATNVKWRISKCCCFATDSYLCLILASGKNAFGVIRQIHVFHNVIHSISHFFHFIERKEAFDDKEAIRLVLRGIHYMLISQGNLRVRSKIAENTFSTCAGERPAVSAIFGFHNLKMDENWELTWKWNEWQLTDFVREGTGVLKQLYRFVRIWLFKLYQKNTVNSFII